MAASDYELAGLIAQAHAAEYAYVPEWQYGMRWNGCVWERDQQDARLIDMAAAVLRQREIAPSNARIRAVASLVQARSSLHVRAPQWDADGMLLNTPGGVYDLRTGERRDPDPALRMTRCTTYAPVESRPDRWREHLMWMFAADVTVIPYLLHYLGYAMTGSIREQCLVMLYGGGANGKSVLLDTLLAILGDYACVAPPGLITSSDGEVRPDSVARMQGVRLALVSETEVGHRLNEGQIKSLTGDSRVSARKLYGQAYDYTPTASYVMATNHKPQCRSTDEGLWRRLRVILCPAYCPLAQQDRMLPERLLEEAGAILHDLMMSGIDYHARGLGECAAVDAETAQYRAEIDGLGSFLAESCEVNESASIDAHALYNAYQRWAEGVGERPWTERAFALAMRERGWVKKASSNGAAYWSGLQLAG